MNIAEVTPYERNPRNNDQAVEAVAKSIKEFGWRAPLVVDKDHVIICGHTRWKAARQLGLDTVPVHVASDLTPEQIQAYRIADNKTAEIADWNYDLLPLELRELQGAQFDLSLLGFDTSELEELLSTATDEVAAGETDPDVIGPLAERLQEEAFRVARRPPPNYYQWILPENDRLMGYIVNVPALHAGRGFAVLLNADEKEHRVAVELGGDSNWKMIGNGREMRLEGLTPLGWPAGKPAPIWPAGWKGELVVPALESVILMNGF